MEEKILVTRSSMPSIEEYVEEIQSIWESRWLTNMGEKHQRLEERLKEYLHVRYVSLFTNGHMALESVIQAMGLKGEVITTPFTFVSTTHAIARNGLNPVFCDINPMDFTIDVEKIEPLITDRTTAIVPVHVYGNVCDVEAIQKLANKYHLKVIYDAAHAFGVKIKGKGVGEFGDASMFSFHATKVFNTIEGGAVCFSDEKYLERLRSIKNFGIKDEETIMEIAPNAKMNEFQAAMGLCNLRHIHEEIEKRKKVVERYRMWLEPVQGIQLSPIQPDVNSNYAYFPILVEEEVFGISRDKIYEELKKENIFSRKYFYPLTSSLQCYKEKFKINETPIADKIAKKVLTLPLYADLRMDQVDKICDTLINLKSK